MAFDIKTATVSDRKKGKFDISTASISDSRSSQAPTSVANPVLVGPSLSMGTAAKPADLPFILSKAGSGFLYGVPEMVAKNPLGGMVEAGLRMGGRLGSSPFSAFPSPVTPAGQAIGTLIDITVPTSRTAGLAFPALTEFAGKQIAGNVKRLERIAQAPKRVRETMKRVGETFKARQEGLKVASKVKAEKFEGSASELASELLKEADQATLKARPLFIEYMGKQSDEYGKSLDSLLAKNEAVNLPISKVQDALGKVLEETGLATRNPVSVAESTVKKWVDELAELSESRKTTIPTRAVLSRLSAFKTGKAYGSGEHVISVVKEKLGEALEDVVPGLDDLRKSYRPYFNFKSKAFDVLQPFAKQGIYETSRGAEFFKKAIGELPPDDARFLIELEERLGGDILKGVRGTGSKMAELAESRKFATKLFEQRSREIAGEASLRMEILKRRLERAKTRVEKTELARQIAKFAKRAAAFTTVRSVAKSVVPSRVIR